MQRKRKMEDDHVAFKAHLDFLDAIKKRNLDDMRRHLEVEAHLASLKVTTNFLL